MFLKMNDCSYLAFADIRRISIYKAYSDYQIKITLASTNTEYVLISCPTIEQAEKELENLVDFITETSKKNNQITVNTVCS